MTPGVAPAGEKTEAWIERPVFVTGLMKTGSTLLLALLDGHPDVLAYPDEPSFERLFGRSYEDRQHMIKDWLFGTPNPLHFGPLIQHDVLAPLGFDLKSWDPIPPHAPTEHLDVDALSRSVRLRGLDESVQREVLDIPRYHRALRQALSRDNVDTPAALMRATISSLAQAVSFRVQPTHWLFKQPLPRFRQASFDRFFEAFPEGRAIVLMRDPRGYVNSLLRYSFSRRPTKPDLARRTAFFLSSIKNLDDDYVRFDQLGAQFGQGRVLTLYYEELTTDTRAVAERTAAFLNIPFHDVLTRPTKLTRPVRVPTATNDRASEVYRGSREKWRTELSRAQILLVESAVDRYLSTSTRYVAVSSRTSRQITRPLLKMAGVPLNVRERWRARS